MGFAETSGPQAGWLRSSSEPLACAIIAITLDVSCGKRDGAGNSRLSRRLNEMKPRSKTGMSSAGLLSKKAEQDQATIVWVDEAGFYLLPMAVRTWAPRGQTPVLRVPLTRDHLSAISGITLDGWLFLQVRPASYDAAAVVGFLRVLLRKLSGKVIVIWDGSPIHRGHEIKDFLSRGAARRLHLEQLPGYAPDLNPDEGIWNYLKRVELGNVCCATLDQLTTELIRARERLRHKREVIRSCSQQCGYSL
jgi:transposase